MVDTTAQRSKIMRAVKSKNTTPEIKVRKLLHAAGYRYVLHKKDLPGKPDIVFPARKKVIFVHGCFWHGHSCTRGNRKPRTNTAYWENKISRNKKRFDEQLNALANLNWDCLTVWECEIRDSDVLLKRLTRFLDFH